MAQPVDLFEIKTSEGASLAAWNAPARGGQMAGARSLLHIHGATFPSMLSVAFRFEGKSWLDDLAAAGFNAWALDFRGFGGSDRYPTESGQGAETGLPCRCAEAAEQIGCAAGFIREQDKVERLSLIAHSWGTLPAGKFAGQQPGLVDRLVLFGPIAQRPGPTNPEALPATRLVTVQAQYDRFVADVPAGHSPVLELDSFPAWGEAYLDSDPASRRRVPNSVAVPSGPAADIRAAWSGALPYDPGKILAPTLIVRGDWDSLCLDADARWLLNALRSCKIKRDVKVPEATHLTHLETGRFALYEETSRFLANSGNVGPNQPSWLPEPAADFHRFRSKAPTIASGASSWTI